MIFFKAAFALYLAAIALAAPGRLIGVSGVGKLLRGPVMFCTSLPNVDIDDYDIVEGIVDADVDVY
jgi:hypothetical protein